MPFWASAFSQVAWHRDACLPPLGFGLHRWTSLLDFNDVDALINDRPDLGRVSGFVQAYESSLIGRVVRGGGFKGLVFRDSLCRRLSALHDHA